MASEFEVLAQMKQEYKYGFRDPEKYVFKARKGLDHEIIDQISDMKGEPDWMRQFRHKALDIFLQKPMPTWGADLSGIDFNDIYYYIKPAEKQGRSWDELPPEIKRTFDRLGIPEAERKFLAGVGAQYESEVVYHSLKEEWEKQGVIFLDTDSALRQHPDLFREYFGTVVPPADNKFAALNSAVWSGGSFIYVPKGVKLDIPLQAYFRINAQNMGQFERTLIIVDEGASVHYVEGCTAPIYASDSLHSAVVEIIVKRGARCRYTTIQNWSNNVYNLVTKRAVAYEEAVMEWIDGNLGCLTGDTMVYTNPSGLTPIRELQPGEHVYALDLDTLTFKYFLVNGLVYSGVKPVYEISVAGRQLQATDNHPFLVLSRQGKQGVGTTYVLQWKPLGQITDEDYVAYVRRLPDEGRPYQISFSPSYRKGYPELRFPQETSEDLMWLLGVYLGDGYIWRPKSGKGAHVYFALPEGDPSRERLLRVLSQEFGARYTLKKRTVVVSSLALAQFLAHLGFTGGAHEKNVPGWVYSLPRRQKLAFLEGYLDSDGCVTKSSYQVTFTSANRRLLEEIQLLAISCGLTIYPLREYISRRSLAGRPEKEYTHYQFCLSKQDIEVLRGKSETTSGQYLGFAPIEKKRYLGEKEVFDIEVDGAHNFVANGLVVHNSKVTMKYPSVYMLGKGARAEILSIAFAGRGQHQDAGGKVVHAAPYTSSRITSKSISKDGGRASYRGLLKVAEGAKGSKANVVCDALILDEYSRSDTYPYIEIDEDDVTIGHEATVSKIGEEQLFYLMSRGLTEEEAATMIVSGFIEPMVKELPMEYAVEMNRLIQLQMEGSVG